MHTVAFRATLRLEPPSYIRISTATAVQPASTTQKLTPFLVPALERLEAEGNEAKTIVR